MALALARTFPGAPLYTALYEPDLTYPEFRELDVRSIVRRPAILRRHHRLSLPILAPAFSSLLVDADLVVCSSSGWAHGARVTGRKVVYCHAPARWLYQTAVYRPSARDRLLLAPLLHALRSWDKRAAASADAYLANSSITRQRIWDTYEIEAEIVPPPIMIDTAASLEALPGVDPGFLLCVSRLLPYKNVTAVVEALRKRPHDRLIVVGDGPQQRNMAKTAPPNVTFAKSVNDAQLRWAYTNCLGVVSASWEDFGLSPVEAAAFGKPSAVVRFGGFLDSVIEGKTGVFFDEPRPDAIGAAIDRLTAATWERATIVRHASQFSEQHFASAIRGATQGTD